MLQIIINKAIALIANWFSGISEKDLQTIKNTVIYYEDKILPNEIKHGKVAELVHELVHEASGTVIDWLIKMCVLWVRKV